MTPPGAEVCHRIAGEDSQETLAEKVFEVMARPSGGQVLGVVDAERDVGVVCCSVTALTLPTSTPAILTVSPGCSPDAFENSAK